MPVIPTNRPIVCIEIDGGNTQAVYRLGGVGLPEVIVVDWDNIKDGDDAGLKVHPSIMARVNRQENQQAKYMRLAILNGRATAAKSRRKSAEFQKSC